MAPRKRVKLDTRDAAEPAIDEAGGVAQDDHFTQLAKQHWLKASKKTAKVKVKQEVIKKEIWDVLEAQDFSHQSLSALDNLQLLENYLWPGFTEDASNHHALLMVMMINLKAREHLANWEIFEDAAANFSIFFKRILSMSIDGTTTIAIKVQIIAFVTHAFQALDKGIVRKECAPLVSISLWHHLSSEAKREKRLDRYPQLRKAWRASLKRFDAVDDAAKARLRFERAWLYTLILDFLNRVHATDHTPDTVLYCERFIEFLADLQSQLPTRRFVRVLLEDLHVVSAIRMTQIHNDERNLLLRDLCLLLKHYIHFPLNDQTGLEYTQEEIAERHSAMLASLQRIALRHFKDKLTILALSNYSSIDRRDELETHLSALTDPELKDLCSHLDIRTTYPSGTIIRVDRQFLMEVLLYAHERRPSFRETAQGLSILPTEDCLAESSLLGTDDYNGSQPLAIPKLNLQYLTIGDFLWRSFVLHRCESFYAIKKDVADTLKRLRPSMPQPGETVFNGFSKMAMPITKPAIIEVLPALVGEDKPSVVRAEIVLDVSRLAQNIRQEWDTLRPGDVVFLLAVEGKEKSSLPTNGTSKNDTLRSIGVRHLRTAEVIVMLDDSGRSLREAGLQNGHSRSRIRRLHVKLDAEMYKKDLARVATTKRDVHESLNLIMRRRGRENNFKPVLESMRSLISSTIPLASWLQDVFLGYGDPAGASYPKIANREESIDYRDTFLDWDHLVQSLPDQNITSSSDSGDNPTPPYVLKTRTAKQQAEVERPAKRRRREVEAQPPSSSQGIEVVSYKLPNTGPYPMDAPKLNHVRFTPAQIRAIISGTQPGLTVIVGPPGTGKTDVATQIINNIYHNFPQQRTLLIAHSNQALNQLFQKIVALDIDERHLLRLGHGEEDLETEASFSKHGRVESFLENRDGYLREVDRLAHNLRAPGAHGQSAETAGYFDEVYIKPAWSRFEAVVEDTESDAAAIVEAFPFHEYFANAPQPLFPEGLSREAVVEIANGCHHHISRIFLELADVRPFEILRRDRDKANHLLTNEARIIAMTSTHAAMRRKDIANLGFHYDNVIMEEAAQITEIENFMPLAMQNPVDGELPLQRVVLCGDHLQNSPIIQNMAFRQYANLEQSLFSRLVRLSVPTITLDQQGRARPSIASLYSWRYAQLGNLPSVSIDPAPEFRTANAGFKYAYQFVEVPDYQGVGEREPTPHFIQNLGEAEYAVAIFQYMRLLGYPASKITILATYAGQKALIRDVLQHRCAPNPLFGMPRIVATVDKYQGEQNDYVILSLTRTTRPGYLRDVRRLTVALSRARLGLYILGRREVFETCFELKPAFDMLLRRPDRLQLVTGELWPATRPINAAIEEGDDAGHVDTVEGECVMEGVEHLGQYVFEMTNAKVGQERAMRGLPPLEMAKGDGAVGMHVEAAAEGAEGAEGAGEATEVEQVDMEAEA